MKRILRAVEAAREDELVIDVAGLDDFDLRDFTTDLEEAGQLLSLGIQSDTLRKPVYSGSRSSISAMFSQEVKERDREGGVDQLRIGV